MADDIESDDLWGDEYPPPPPPGASQYERRLWAAKIATSDNPPWDCELGLAIEEAYHRYPFCED